MCHGKLTPVSVKSCLPFFPTAVALACSAQTSLGVDRNSLAGGFCSGIRFCWRYLLRSCTLFLPYSFPAGGALHAVNIDSTSSCDVGLCLLKTRRPGTTFGAGHTGCG